MHPEHDFSKSRDFIADGLLDSFDIVNLVLELEQKFRIVIDGEDIKPDNFLSVERLSLLVERCLGRYEVKI